MTVKILVGDCLEMMRGMPDESVHCVVTSPPYWGLRDYGVDGQLGLEPTLGEYIDNMVAVFREVRRVLRKDGTLWLNMGDCYASNWPCSRRSVIGAGSLENGKRENRPPRMGAGLKDKDLVMMPARVALALQADGWWLRSEIIWAKPNPMPESVTDRPTSAHEKVYLLAKSQRYFYDADAVREPALWAGDARAGQGRIAYNGKRLGEEGAGQEAFVSITENRNLHNVWTIATKPIPDAHFATFPPDLVEPCIKAGCPKDGVVLDPFGGAGTVGLVADRLGRDAILIELNPEYAEMAEHRIKDDAGMFAT
jgi:DNA modification methylase